MFNGRPTTVYVSLLEGQLRLKRTEIRSFLTETPHSFSVFTCKSLMPRRPNIPSLFGIKLSVAVDFLCPTFKNKLNDTLTRDHFQLPIQALSIVGDRGNYR